MGASSSKAARIKESFAQLIDIDLDALTQIWKTVYVDNCAKDPNSNVCASYTKRYMDLARILKTYQQLDPDTIFPQLHQLVMSFSNRDTPITAQRIANLQRLLGLAEIKVLSTKLDEAERGLTSTDCAQRREELQALLARISQRLETISGQMQGAPIDY